MAHNAPQHNGDHNRPSHNGALGGNLHNGVNDPTVDEIGHDVDDILLESGSHLLLENGSAIVLDAESIPAAENFSATSASNTAFLFQSTGQSRDMEVELSARPAGATVFLRYDGTKAIYFYMVGATTLHIGLASGIAGQTWSTPSSTVGRIYQDSGLSAGTIVCGVSGVDIYCKVNGTEVLRFKDWHIPTSGYAAVKASSGSSVSGTATFLAPANLYSVPGSNFWDIRDFGAKAVSTTGSISASSTSLVVADASQFAVGDHVIVAVGGESGAGARGTAGVGGTWPALSYADAAARAADTTQANNTWAYEVDTGDVYRWATGSPGSWMQSTVYYTAKVVPRALFAKITAKSGSTLTLSTAATATATNATVYFDNATKLTNLTTSIYYNAGLNGSGNLLAFETTQATIYIPAGDWALGGRVTVGHGNRQITGAGATSILRSPAGSPAIGLKFANGCSGEICNNIKMIGNVGDNGFGFGWEVDTRCDGASGTGMTYDSNEDAMTSGTSNAANTYGILMTCTDAVVRDVVSVNAWASVGGSYCTDCWIYDCSTVWTGTLRQYIVWLYQLADSSGGGIDGCSIDSDYLIPGFELFRSTGSTMTDCTSTNATMALNSSGDVTIVNPTITIEANSQHSSGAFSSSNPIINVNNNIGGGYAGDPVTISGVNITQAGVVNASNDILSGIVIDSANTNVSINGTTIAFPDFVVGGRTDMAAVLSDAANTDVANLTVTGQSRYAVVGSGTRNIHLRNNATIASGSTITNCTAGDTYLV